MHNIASFVRLDYITIKPYMTGKNFLIYVGLALFMTITSGSAVSGIGVGGMMAMLYSSYPFAIGEKSNSDALYVTLAIERKHVVAGRFLFVLTFNLLLMLGAVALGFLGMFIARTIGVEILVDDPLAWIVLAAFFAVVQAVQLPLYFKLGYAKARFLSVVPFAFFIAFYFGFMTLARDEQLLANVLNIFNPLLENPLLSAALGVAIVVLIVFVSYRLSQVFYRKREF